MVGGAFVACLMLGCARTVYANVFERVFIRPRLSATLMWLSSSGRRRLPSRAPHRPLTSRFCCSVRARAAEFRTGKFNAGPIADVFNDRFAARHRKAKPRGRSWFRRRRTARSPLYSPPSPDRQVAQMARLPVPRPADAGPAAGPAKNTACSLIREMTQSAKARPCWRPSRKRETHDLRQAVWQLKSSGATLAYASADASATGTIDRPKTAPGRIGALRSVDRGLAIFRAVRLICPDGTKLEAHSGLGSKLDDPKFVARQDVSPDAAARLRPGAAGGAVPWRSGALRLIPVGGDEAIYGRSGLLAHTYMPGPNGDPATAAFLSRRDYNVSS